MNRSPIAATLLVALFGLGVPLALTQRLADELLPLRAMDVPLFIGCVAWVLVARAVIERENPMAALIENRLSPSWQAHSLVEQSLLGVGFGDAGDGDGTTPKLYQLQSPHSSIDALLPSPVQALMDERIHGDAGEAGLLRPQPTLHHDDPVDPLIQNTEEYAVQRGDTFWSIAEARLGDGRHWKAIEQLNTGREVGPDVLFASGNDLRIGWSIIVPVAAETEGDE